MLSSARILGVDPGTRSVGYGVIEPRPGRGTASSYAYVECGVIVAPSRLDMPGRLHIVARGLSEIVEELRPAVLVLEKAFHGKNASSALKLGQARGAIMLLAAQHELPVLEYTPAEIKQTVVGHGRATKQQIQHRVRLLFRLRRAPQSDAADALAIALCHAQRAGFDLVRVPRLVGARQARRRAT